MAEEKKGIYHSELRKAGPVKVTVESEAQESTKKKGSWYVTLKIDGRTRYYSPENQACLDFFNGTKGRTFTIVAEGGGKGQEESATITFVGAAGTTAAARPAPKKGMTPHNTAVPQGHPAHKPLPPANRPPAQPAAAPAAANRPIFGATVGMAINQSVQFGIALGEAWSPAEIMNRASDLIRISQALEAGHLMPKFSERNNPENDGR